MRYELWKIGFHFTGPEKVADLAACAMTIRSAPSAKSVIDTIGEIENKAYGEDVTGDIYISDVRRSIEVYGDSKVMPDDGTPKWIAENQETLVAAYGIDWDESDHYFVLQIDD